MAHVADTVAVPGSNIKTGDGTNSRTFTLPGSPGMKIQSVVATVDNTAGADTTATLTIKDQSGEVIATQKQDDVIPAADTGTASFALRLSGRKSAGIRFGVTNTGSFLDVITTTHGGSAGYAINLETTGASTANGVRVMSVADVSLYAATTAQMYGGSLLQLGVTDAGQPMLIETNGGSLDVQTNAGQLTLATDGAVSGAIFVKAGFGLIQLEGDDVTVRSTGKVRVYLDGGQSLTVLDNTGGPIFKVDNNGDLHGKTGKALVFNL